MSVSVKTSTGQGPQAKNGDGRTSIVLPAGFDKNLFPIGKEVLGVHEAAEFASQAWFEQAKIWRTLNYWLGVPAAVTATLPGSAILGQSDSWNLSGLSESVIGGILALASSFLESPS